MKKGLILVIIFLLVPIATLAQTTTVEPSPQESPSVTGRVRQNLQERREELKQKFEDRREELQERREQLREQFKQRREAFKVICLTLRRKFFKECGKCAAFFYNCYLSCLCFFSHFIYVSLKPIYNYYIIYYSPI